MLYTSIECSKLRYIPKFIGPQVEGSSVRLLEHIQGQGKPRTRCKTCKVLKLLPVEEQGDLEVAAREGVVGAHIAQGLNDRLKELGSDEEVRPASVRQHITGGHR